LEEETTRERREIGKATEREGEEAVLRVCHSFHHLTFLKKKRSLYLLEHLGKSYILPTSKKLCKVKKRVHLQQFGIIHLPNTDLTCIRNPEINKIVFMSFHLLKNLHQESLFILYFFRPPTYRENTDGNHDPCTNICAWGGEFCQVSIFATVGDYFFCFTKIRYMPS
jgi:hypothetical protein